MAKKLKEICRRYKEGEPLNEDELYIVQLLYEMNYHESYESNISTFVEIADELGLLGGVVV
jgi:hypothetical protein